MKTWAQASTANCVPVNIPLSSVAMSTFSDKIRQGLRPTAREWEMHLAAVHADDPHMTPEGFARFTTDQGENSYSILAEVLPLPAQNLAVLDLACGDGYLVPYLLARLGPQAHVTGLDIAAEGIELARVQAKDCRTSFVVGRAQEMPFRTGSLDLVVCHMAIMLMMPIEAVVSEIKRVLKPNGRFSAVTISTGSQGFHRTIQRLAGLFVQAHVPRLFEMWEGSAASANKAPLENLFGSGYAHEVREFELHLHVPCEGVWEYIKKMYFTSLLPPSAQFELKDELMAVARDHRDDEGKVLFHVPMKRLSMWASHDDLR